MLTALVAATPGTASFARSAEPPRTLVVEWSPFLAADQLKPQLAVHYVGRGFCGEGSGSARSSLAYRCSFGRFLADPCWRRSPRITEQVVCVGDPWARSATIVRVPRLLLRTGVTFGERRRRDPPWALELQDGDRCVLLSGARGSVRVRGRLVAIDYHCRSGLDLVRNLRRGRVWRIGSARPRDAGDRYAGDVIVRRTFFVTLPAEMQRQNMLAREAAVAAAAGVASSRLDVTPFRVRLALPRANWARVLLYVSARGRDDAFYRHPVLRRVDGKWESAHALKPYCTNLAPAIRRQLFEPRECAVRRRA